MEKSTCLGAVILNSVIVQYRSQLVACRIVIKFRC